MCEPAVVSTPSVQKRSLTAIGMPSSGRASPRARRSSAASAMASARSGVSVMKALSGRAASTRRDIAAANSRAENSLRASPSRASARVNAVRDALTRPPWARRRSPLRCVRRVGEDRLAAIAVGHPILAHRQAACCDARHRRDSARVDLVQLLDPGQDLRQFAGERLELGFGQPDARQRGNMRHGGLVQRHDSIASATRARHA